MTELVELSSSEHGDLKVTENCALLIAKKQHIITIKVPEVGKAVGSFPVFVTKNNVNGNWALSAIVGLELEQNLFEQDNYWEATYLPTVMQTFPFFLMNSPREEGAYTVGIDPSNPAFSTQDGEAIFDEKGKASIYLSGVTKMLEEDLKGDVQTYNFLQKLEELDLIKEMDVMVHYADDRVNTLKGLHTIDEEKLQALDVEVFDGLRQQGYLAPCYAMLISIFQLNTLILKNNRLDGTAKVKQVKMEVTKDKGVTW